jgi:hypothetical protein
MFSVDDRCHAGGWVTEWATTRAPPLQLTPDQGSLGWIPWFDPQQGFNLPKNSPETVWVTR